MGLFRQPPRPTQRVNHVPKGPYAFVCGAECVALSDHWTTLVGTPTIDTGTKRNGAASIRLNPSASTESVSVTTAASGNIAVFHGYFRFATLPGTTQSFMGKVCRTDNGDTQFGYSTTSGSMYLHHDSDGVGVQGSTTISAGQWYRLDIRANMSANPWVMDWSIDGVAQTQYTPAVAATTSNIGFRLGGNISSTYDVYWDDFAYSTVSADYPISAQYYVPPGTPEIMLLAELVATSANAEIATGTGSALNASIHIKPNAGFGSGTGTAATTTPTTYAADDFSDTQVDTWAAADTGGTWAYSGAAASYDKTAGAGLLAVPGFAAVLGASVPVSTADIDAYARFSVPTTGANVGVGIVARATDATLATCYYGGVWFESDNSITAFLHERAAGSHIENAFVLNQGTYSADQWWWVRFQIIGTDQRVKVWPDGSQEPAAWNTTDTDATISAAGRVGIIGRSGASAGAQSPKVDDLTALEVVAVGGSVHIKPNAGIASGTGLANVVSGHIKPNAGIATGTGSALAAFVNIQPQAAVATGTGLAYNVIPLVKPNAGLATGTGTAHSPPILYAQAGLATGTGTANNASVLIKPNAGLASGTGLANNASEHIKPFAGIASGTGAANGPLVSIAPRAGLASGDVARTIASDTFSRTLSNSWGTATIGGPWTITLQTGASDADVDGDLGTLVVGNAGQNTQGMLAGILQRDVDITVNTSIDKTPATAGAFLHVGARAIGTAITGSTRYVGQVQVTTAGGLTVNFVKFVAGTQTAITGGVASGVTVTPGQLFKVRFQCSGASPTTLRLKVWLAADAEPGSWLIEDSSDSEATLQVQGGLSLRHTTSASLTNVPIAFGITAYDASWLGAYGDALDATPKVMPNAGLASGTGTAQAAFAHVKVNAGLATGTGLAYDATVTTAVSDVSVNAELASGTGAALNASVRVSPNAGIATGTGLANNASEHVKPFGGLASGTGTANNAIPHVKPNAGIATGTGQAYDATVSTIPYRSANAEVATGTGSALNASVHVQPNAGLVSGTGTTNAAFVNVASNAEVAAGSGQAYDATVSTTVSDVFANAELASGTGAAYDASVRISPNAGLASGTGVGNAVSGSVAPNAAIATGTGLAGAAIANVAPNAGLASGTGTAYDATVTTVPYRSANAEVASGTGTAHQPNASIAPNAGLAAGTGTAGATSANVSVNAGLASGTGVATDVSTDIKVNAGLASGTGSAYDASVFTGVQTLRPIADLSGNWHGEDARTTNLYTSVDDDPFEDATYVESPTDPISSDFHEFDLPSAGDPLQSTGHVVRYRYGGEGATTLVVELRQGATVIASWQHVDPTTPALAEQTLTEAEADAITDYTDLRVRVRAV